MRLAGIDDAFELGVGQQAVTDDGGRQMRPIARHRRCDRGHRRRLHELGGVRLRTGNTDRLQSVFFIKRLGDPTALDRLPVHWRIIEFDAFGFEGLGRNGGRSHRAGAHSARDRRACDRGGRDRGPSGNMIGDPTQQRGDIGRDAGRRWEGCRIIGRDLVDHGQPGVDRGAMPGIGRAVHGGGEDDTPAFLQPRERVGPGGIVGREARPGDGDQASAIGEPRQRGRNMTVSGVGHSTGDVGHHRERRIHQHDARGDADIEVIVDLRGVEPGHGGPGKEMVEQSGASFRHFVQHERSAGEFCEDGEQASATRWLQHAVGRRDRGGGAGGQSQRDRGRELLERLALFGAAGVGGEKARDLGQHRQHSGGRRGFGAKGRTEFAQEQNRRCLASFIGSLPFPCAGRIGGAESGLHRGAQHSSIDATAVFEIVEDEPGGCDDAGSGIGIGGRARH